MIKGVSRKGKNLRDATILKLRDEMFWTLQRIGDEYGISRQRVCQIIEKQIGQERSKTKETKT